MRAQLAHRMCKCGCEVMFQPAGPNHVFSPECREASDRARKSRARSYARLLPARAGAGRVVDSGRPKVCRSCANLAHMRPVGGCPPRSLDARGRLKTCGLPHVPMTAKEAAYVSHVRSLSYSYDREIDKEGR